MGWNRKARELLQEVRECRERWVGDGTLGGAVVSLHIHMGKESGEPVFLPAPPLKVKSTPLLLRGLALCGGEKESVSITTYAIGQTLVT